MVSGTNADALAARVSASRKQFFVHALADDAHLAVLSYVHVVDVTAVEKLRSLHVLVVRQQAFHRAVGLAVVVSGASAPVRQHGRDGLQLGHMLLQAYHVVVDHAPLAFLAEAGVWLCCVSGHDDGRVGGEPFKVALQHFLQSLAAAEQRHEHEHAPEHAEAGEEAACLVTCKRIEYFAKAVYVEFHCCCFLLRIMG